MKAKRTVIASPVGLRRLEKERRMSGKSADVIAGCAGVSRSSAQKFFNGKPISVENFQSLCNVLGLNWKDIVELEEIAPSTTRKRIASVIAGSLDDLGPTELAKFQAIVRTLQQLVRDASIETVDIEEGSIRLILEGFEKGIENLRQLFDEGELAEILGVPVVAVEPIELNALNKEGDALKALLISKIQSQDALRANLREVDLSGADLYSVNLMLADLRKANLSGADLTEADLSGANLRGADLSRSILDQADLILAKLPRADLHGANLHGADLRGAELMVTNLYRTYLRGAIVEGARFGDFQFLEDEKSDLIRQGAIFDDSTE